MFFDMGGMWNGRSVNNEEGLRWAEDQCLPVEQVAARLHQSEHWLHTTTRTPCSSGAVSASTSLVEHGRGRLYGRMATHMVGGGMSTRQRNSTTTWSRWQRSLVRVGVAYPLQDDSGH